MKKYSVDPKVGADQRGHGIGVSLGVYAESDRQEKKGRSQHVRSGLGLGWEMEVC